MNLKQIKFSLAVVINLLAALTFGYFCFLGANFFTLGDKGTSITVTAIITLLLIGTSLGAKFLKQTKRNFKSRFIWEIVLLVLFTLLTASFTYFPFSHYFSVSENETQIKSKLNSSIAQAGNMYVEYEKYVNNRKSNYKANLESAILTMHASNIDFKKYDFKTNSIAYDKQIKRKMITIGFDLVPSSFIAMKDVNSKWLADSKQLVNDWKPIGLVDVINNIDKNSNKWKADLITISKTRETGEEKDAVDFTYSLPFNEVKNYFTSVGNPTPLSVIYAILLYVLMLLSWIFTKRDSKWPGLKVIFGYGESSENEL
ncbi:MAG: hypothetical protein KA210_00900 [Bacteroidia bacterium]|nr:hypothetical protein [Bacteroidia bacterium]